MKSVTDDIPVDLGVRITGFHTRTIEQCTNCIKPRCTLCPNYETESSNFKLATKKVKEN